MLNRVELLHFKAHTDSRGSLVALQEGDIPFAPVRVYYITNPQGKRGQHAHYHLQQVLVCLAGNCKIMADDGKNQEVYTLQSPDVGLYFGGLIWREMKDFSADAVLMVLASERYDTTDYIHDYEKFCQSVRDMG